MTTKIKILFLGLVFLQSATCNKEEFKNLPSCLQQKIADLKAERVTNPPSSIWQYEYEGQIVYYVPAVCCDIPSQLYNNKCELICSPDGGFTGKGDGRCSDFAKKRTKEKLIWKDDR